MLQRVWGQSIFLDERADLFSTTADPPVILKDDKGKTFALDNDMTDILLLMGKQTNTQFESISVDPHSNKFKINGIDVSLVADGIKVEGKIYYFSKGFAMFTTCKDVTEKDVKGDVQNKTISKGYWL